MMAALVILNIKQRNQWFYMLVINVTGCTCYEGKIIKSLKVRV